MRYVLIANEAKDTQFLYADFAFEKNMSMCLFDYTKKRIGMIKCLDLLNIKKSNLTYRLFFRRIFKKTIDSYLMNVEEDEIVFVVLARAYEKYGSHMISHLREHYPSCKIILYLTDLIRNMRFSLDIAKEDFDIVCSLDKKEAKENELYYVLEPFSTRRLSDIPLPKESKVDVSFVGAAKGRYGKIMWLYDSLSKKGLKCVFYIVGVEKEKQIKGEGLHYDEFLDFEELLKLVANSKSVIEIMQDGMYSATTRYAEAMLYGKNLITDCPALENENANNIIMFNDETEFDTDKILANNNVDINMYIEKFSIQSFINAINEHILNEK